MSFLYKTNGVDADTLEGRVSRSRTSIANLYVVLKNELKMRSLTYRDVAGALDTTENSIKLRFSHQSLSMEQIMTIAELLKTTLTDLMRKVELPSIAKLTKEQELILAKDMRLLLVLIFTMDDWTIQEIAATYDMSEAQCIKYLLTLDHMGLINLLPGNIVRKRIVRGVEFEPGGPLDVILRAHLPDFFDNNFDAPVEYRFMGRASLTPAAIERFHGDMRQLKQKLNALHEECKIAPAEQRHNVVVVSGIREWEQGVFAHLRRKSSKAK